MGDVRMRLEGVGGVKALLAARTPKGKLRTELQVGYSAPYAVYVHEDLEAFHQVGRAKFLEGPFRRLRPELGRMIREDLRAKKGLEYAVLRAGKWFLRVTLPLVPVDTGRLRASGFVRAV